MTVNISPPSPLSQTLKMTRELENTIINYETARKLADAQAGILKVLQDLAMSHLERVWEKLDRADELVKQLEELLDGAGENDVQSCDQCGDSGEGYHPIQVPGPGHPFDPEDQTVVTTYLCETCYMVTPPAEWVCDSCGHVDDTPGEKFLTHPAGWRLMSHGLWWCPDCMDSLSDYLKLQGRDK